MRDFSPKTGPSLSTPWSTAAVSPTAEPSSRRFNELEESRGQEESRAMDRRRSSLDRELSVELGLGCDSPAVLSGPWDPSADVANCSLTSAASHGSSGSDAGDFSRGLPPALECAFQSSLSRRRVNGKHASDNRLGHSHPPNIGAGGRTRTATEGPAGDLTALDSFLSGKHLRPAASAPQLVVAASYTAPMPADADVDARANGPADRRAAPAAAPAASEAAPYVRSYQSAFEVDVSAASASTTGMVNASGSSASTKKRRVIKTENDAPLPPASDAPDSKMALYASPSHLRIAGPANAPAAGSVPAPVIIPATEPHLALGMRCCPTPQQISSGATTAVPITSAAVITGATVEPSFYCVRPEPFRLYRLTSSESVLSEPSRLASPSASSMVNTSSVGPHTPMWATTSMFSSPHQTLFASFANADAAIKGPSHSRAVADLAATGAYGLPLARMTIGSGPAYGHSGSLGHASAANPEALAAAAAAARTAAFSNGLSPRRITMSSVEGSAAAREGFGSTAYVPLAHSQSIGPGVVPLSSSMAARALQQMSGAVMMPSSVSGLGLHHVPVWPTPPMSSTPTATGRPSTSPVVQLSVLPSAQAATTADDRRPASSPALLTSARKQREPSPAASSTENASQGGGSGSSAGDADKSNSESASSSPRSSSGSDAPSSKSSRFCAPAPAPAPAPFEPGFQWTFVNYGIEDREELLSGVAPSGNNKIPLKDWTTTSECETGPEQGPQQPARSTTRKRAGKAGVRAFPVSRPGGRRAALRK